MKNRLLRYIVYFKRGHNSYLAFAISLANFIIIQYRLLVEYIPSLEAVFQSLTLFIVSFVIAYVPLATVIGWIDTWHLTLPIETEVNPYFIKPVGKEKIAWEYLLAVFTVIEKIAEEKGLETSPIAETRKKVEEWIGS